MIQVIGTSARAATRPFRTTVTSTTSSESIFTTRIRAIVTTTGKSNASNVEYV